MPPHMHEHRPGPRHHYEPTHQEIMEKLEILEDLIREILRSR